MKWFTILASLALFCGISSANARQLAPAIATPPVSLSGSWNFEYPITLRSPNGRPLHGVPICTLTQTGNRLNGICKILWGGAGPVTGKIDGRHIEFQWNFRFCPEIITPEYSSQFAVTRFRGELGDDNVLHGGYQSFLQVGWARPFFVTAATPDDEVPCYFPHYGWPTYKIAPKDEHPWKATP